MFYSHRYLNNHTNHEGIMHKRVKVKEALQKSHAYKDKPAAPSHLKSDALASCEIRAYHQRLFKKSSKGKEKKTRFVSGYIFIFPIDMHGNVGRKPLRILHTSQMTLRTFASFARGFTQEENPHFQKALQKFA